MTDWRETDCLLSLDLHVILDGFYALDALRDCNRLVNGGLRTDKPTQLNHTLECLDVDLRTVDLTADKLDAVVVYKVDRLPSSIRSLQAASRNFSMQSMALSDPGQHISLHSRRPLSPELGVCAPPHGPFWVVRLNLIFPEDTEPEFGTTLTGDRDELGHY